MRKPRSYSTEEKLQLWKWMAQSGLEFKTRYALFGDPEYDEDAEEQPPAGYSVTAPLSGYRQIVGEGRTEEDAIADTIINRVFDSLQLTHVVYGDGRRAYEQRRRYEKEGVWEITVEAAEKLVNDYLRTTSSFPWLAT